jgi:hypothetical protein
MFVIVGKNGQLFRMRKSDAQTDPIVCIESAETASGWMVGSNVSMIDYSIKEIAANPHQIVGEMLGISPEDVSFVMFRPEST